MKEDYHLERFSKFDVLERGELNLDIGGNIIRIKYHDGNLYTNTDGDIGRVQLNVEDIMADSELKGDDFAGSIGATVVKILNNPITRKEYIQRLKLNDINLYCSRSDNAEIITIPVLLSLQDVNDISYRGFIVNKYFLLNTAGHIMDPPSENKVYLSHRKIIIERELTIIRNDDSTKIDTRKLLTNAMDVYTQTVEYWRNLSSKIKPV